MEGRQALIFPARHRLPNMDLRLRLARTLRRQRLSRRWTYSDAAAVLKLPVDHYKRLEEGTLNATLQTLERISVGLRLDVRLLFDL